jgi:hypothetical protein
VDDEKPVLSGKSIGAGASPSKNWLTRRQAMQKLLAGVGGALAAPAIISAHPVYRHLGAESAFWQAESKAGEEGWAPQFLDQTQHQTLLPIAERMVPGSTQAQVNRIIDRLLTVDSASNRTNFLSSLTALDNEAQHKYGRRFAVLSPNQQDDVLSLCAADNPSPEKDIPADPDELPPPKAPVTRRDHFENLKGWIVGTFYATEPGMRELGWTEDFYFDQLPGCQHEAEHASGASFVTLSAAVEKPS